MTEQRRKTQRKSTSANSTQAESKEIKVEAEETKVTTKTSELDVSDLAVDIPKIPSITEDSSRKKQQELIDNTNTLVVRRRGNDQFTFFAIAVCENNTRLLGVGAWCAPHQAAAVYEELRKSLEQYKDVQIILPAAFMFNDETKAQFKKVIAPIMGDVNAMAYRNAFGSNIGDPAINFSMKMR